MGKYVAMERIVPNKKIKILEKNGRNCTVGAWIGYWNQARGTFNLYPDSHYRYVDWPGGKVPSEKIVINASQMYVRMPDYTDRPFLGKRGA